MMGSFLSKLLRRAQKLTEGRYWSRGHYGRNLVLELTFRPGLRFASQFEVEFLPGIDDDDSTELNVSVEFGWLWFIFSYTWNPIDPPLVHVRTLDDVPAGARKGK